MITTLQFFYSLSLFAVFLLFYVLYLKYFDDLMFWIKLGSPIVPTTETESKYLKFKNKKKKSYSTNDSFLRNKFYYLKLTKNEEWIVNKNYISENEVRIWHCKLERNLTFNEQKVIENSSISGIMIDSKYFQK